MPKNHTKFSVLLTILAVAPFAIAQSADTGTAHKAAARALLNSNNTGAAHLACPPQSALCRPPTRLPVWAVLAVLRRDVVAREADAGEARFLRKKTGSPRAVRYSTTSTC